MALIAAHLSAGVILVVTVQRQVYDLPLFPPPYPLPPFSPPLISLMVSVDVKHHAVDSGGSPVLQYHIYLLTLAFLGR